PITDEEINLTDNEPAQELCEQVRILTAEAREALLQQALAVSNEKCNGLIMRLNVLVEELTLQVRSVRWRMTELEENLKENNENLLKKLRMQAESMSESLNGKIRELKSLTIQIQTEVRTATAKATDEASKLLNTRINEAADKAIATIDRQAEEISKKAKAIEKEIDHAREEIHYERGFRKFFFWAAPVLLLAQSILTVIMLLR
uniref:hypothetical protein n=1 Tax=uncultured Butyricimonas sp. TaxID=1268785 RepID=UPI0026DB3913